jgi:TRAP-type mannitol/chloroaromatic compound transport system substrate-binding protein
VPRGTRGTGACAVLLEGKIPAGVFRRAVRADRPQISGWFYHGGGIELYQETYAPFGLVPFPIGNSGTQMGGWFNKEINSAADLEGLKMRIPGLGGEVLSRLGGTTVAIPAAEVFTALQNGTIDATEWVGPMNDLALGLFRAAVLLLPRWQEPGSPLECLVNAEALAALPPDLQAIVKYACQAANQDMYAEFEARNGEALQALLNEYGVELREFPEDVLAELRRATLELLEEQAAADPLSGKVWASQKAFLEAVRPWTRIGAQSLVQHR